MIIGSAVLRRTQVRCNCFGGSAEVVSGIHVLRNLVLLACALTGLALAVLHRDSGARLSVEAIAADVLCAGVLAVVLVHIEALALLVGPDRTPNSNRGNG
ncbi:MauE/DoxX family redox-associated membrane protein [Catenulispora yoronensis]